MAQRGFTLIELLVVVAIISLLSSMALASLNDTRARARDAQRITELRQIRTALEQYYVDHSEYPSEVFGDWANHNCDMKIGSAGTCSAGSDACRHDLNRNGLGECGGKIGCDADNVGTIDGGCNPTTGETENILGEYMGSIPADPVNDDKHFYYFDANHEGGSELRPVLFISKLE